VIRLALDDRFQGAYLADHAANVIEPADALLVLEVTLDTGQRLTRPAAHDGIPHINWQTSARVLPLNFSGTQGRGLPVPQIRMAQDIRNESGGPAVASDIAIGGRDVSHQIARSRL
jgi:hypothetical protein